MYLTLTYFHSIKGPIVYLSYPEEIPENIKRKIVNFFDLDINASFFEIVLIEEKQRIINFYFELPSTWARGDVEMCMISVIMKMEYDSTLIYDFLKESYKQMASIDNIYKGFYKFDDFHDNDIEIDLNYELIKKILRTCLDKLIEKLKVSE
jgi:hypothetical protein